MPIYLMSIRVLLSVEFWFTLKTYLKGAPFYNALKLGMAPPPLRYACAEASLRCGGARGAVCAAKELQPGLGKMAGEWHLPWGESKRWHE